MSQALYRKWRPQQWAQVIGQQHIVQTLRNAVTTQKVAHAHIFAGPRGTGKTTTARLLAKAVNCLHPQPAQRPCDQCEHCLAVNQGRFLDLIEIDAASNTSVEDVRSLRDKINFAPNQGRYKVYIIDEVHMLSTAAFNALLKTLEEPPAHAMFILATTEIHKIPATVLSRCQRHEFRRIPVNEIVYHLKQIAASENLQVDEDALYLVARQSTGCMRDAISLLDQLSTTGSSIDLATAQTVLGTAASQAVFDLLDALLQGDSAAGLNILHTALDAGSDPRQFARQVVDYLRDVLMVRMGNAASIEATPEVRERMARHASGFEISRLLELLRAFNQAAADARGSWQPALPLEMAYLGALNQPEESEPALAARPQSPRVAASPRENTLPPVAPAPSPKSSAPPAVAAPPVSPESAAEFQKIIQNWRKILEFTRQQNPTVQGFLNSCKPLGLRQTTLFLGCNGQFVKQRLDQPENAAIVRQAVLQAIGLQVTLHNLVMGEKRGEIPAEVDADGMVAAALRELGGEIIDMQ